MTLSEFNLLLELLIFMVIIALGVIWYTHNGNFRALQALLEKINLELVTAHQLQDAYRTENSSLTLRLLEQSKKLRHAYREIGELRIEMNQLRSQLNLPLIDFPKERE